MSKFILIKAIKRPFFSKLFISSDKKIAKLFNLSVFLESKSLREIVAGKQVNMFVYSRFRLQGNGGQHNFPYCKSRRRSLYVGPLWHTSRIAKQHQCSYRTCRSYCRFGFGAFYRKVPHYFHTEILSIKETSILKNYRLLRKVLEFQVTSRLLSGSF